MQTRATCDATSCVAPSFCVTCANGVSSAFWILVKWPQVLMHPPDVLRAFTLCLCFVNAHYVISLVWTKSHFVSLVSTMGCSKTFCRVHLIGLEFERAPSGMVLSERLMAPTFHSITERRVSVTRAWSARCGWGLVYLVDVIKLDPRVLALGDRAPHPPVLVIVLQPLPTRGYARVHL